MTRRRTPQNFTGRAGSRLPGRVRRSLDAAIDTDRRVNDTMEVDTDGRIGTAVSRSGGIRVGRDGLELDPQQLGDKNHDPMAMVKKLETTATTADLIEKFNDLIFELRRTKRMR